MGKTPAMMLAAKYRAQNVSGWWVSEKLDGWRAFFDGNVLRTRTWRVIHAPASLTASLPVGIALDGELHAGRGGFLTMQSLGQINRPSDPRWAGVRYSVFDCPSVLSIPLEKRLATARRLAVGPQVEFVEQAKVESAAAMWRRFAAVVKAGGEGLVLRRPGSFYEFGLTSDLLKVKPVGVD